MQLCNRTVVALSLCSSRAAGKASLRSQKTTRNWFHYPAGGDQKPSQPIPLRPRIYKEKPCSHGATNPEPVPLSPAPPASRRLAHHFHAPLHYLPRHTTKTSLMCRSSHDYRADCALPANAPPSYRQTSQYISLAESLPHTRAYSADRAGIGLFGHMSTVWSATVFCQSADWLSARFR